MPNQTTNYGLIKPLDNETADIGVINQNMDTIDSQLNVIDSQAGQNNNELSAHKADKVQHIAYATASGTDSYTATITGITALTEGLSVKIKFPNANTGPSTLNINSLGAKTIQKSNGSALSAGNIKAGQIMHLVYGGSVFQLLGEGGEYGTASAGEVLSGYTLGTESGIVSGALALTGDAVAANVLAGKSFYNTNAKSKLTGTIPSKGADTITPGPTNQIIAANQYLIGAQTIAGSANLLAPNIKEGVNIFGVVGTLQAGAILLGSKGTISEAHVSRIPWTLSLSVNAPTACNLLVVFLSGMFSNSHDGYPYNSVVSNYKIDGVLKNSNIALGGDIKFFSYTVQVNSGAHTALMDGIGSGDEDTYHAITILYYI